MLKLLLIDYILHLLKYIETHVIRCFANIHESFNEFFWHILTINIYM
jgi:hypothetical protein